MKSYLTIFLKMILVCSFAVKCTHPIENQGLNTIMVSPEYSNEPTTTFQQVFKSVSYLPLETKESCLISKVKQLVVSKNDIFVLDEMEAAVFHFSKEGRFVNKIGRKGKGPGEFLNPVHFIVDETSKILKIYDRRIKKISIFDYTGNLKDEIKTDYYFSSFFQDQNNTHYWAFMTNDGNELQDEENMNFLQLNPEGEVTQKVSGVFNHHLLFCNGAHFSKEMNQEKVSFVLPLHNKIFAFDGIDSISIKYNLDFQDGTIPSHKLDDLGKERKNRMTNHEIFKKLISEYAIGYTQFLDLDNWIYFEYLFRNRGRGIFFDKKKDFVYNFSKIPYEKDGWGTLFPISYGENNNLYAIIHPVALIRLLETGKNIYSRRRLKAIEELLIELKEDSNPIIFKYELAEK